MKIDPSPPPRPEDTIISRNRRDIRGIEKWVPGQIYNQTREPSLSDLGNEHLQAP